MMLPDDQKQWRLPFPVKLTAVTSSSGIYVYSWTEQQLDGATGAYSDATPGRSGDSTNCGLRELNNTLIDVTSTPIATAKLRGDNAGDLVYEFDAGLATSSQDKLFPYTLLGGLY